MGTRAQFFIGDPQNLERRKWLGCVAWDGYPQGDIGEAFADVKTVFEFEAAVLEISEERTDYCDPKVHGFPFPWVENLFLTDCTYAFFDGAVQFSYYNSGFVPLLKYLQMTPNERTKYRSQSELPKDVPAPTTYWDRSAPDSILIVSA